MTKPYNRKRKDGDENNKNVKKVFIELDQECILDTSKYRVKNNANRFLTTEMFDDHIDNRRMMNKISPFSLYNNDHVVDQEGNTIYSMKKIFLEMNDTTGYKCAKKCLGNFEHWQKLLGNSVIRNEIDKWIDELKVKELALLKQACINELQTQGKGQMSAARLIVQLNNQDPNSRTNVDNTKGKEDKGASVEHDSEFTTEEHNSMLEDLKRLNN